MLEKFIYLDEQWFLLINGKMHHPILDQIVPYLRDKVFWTPLYVVLLVLIIRKFKLKTLWVLGGIGLTITLADRISAGLIKPLFERLRPCNNPEIVDLVHRVVDCGSGYSFVSSHATNHFALAIFFIHLFLKRSNSFWLHFGFLTWAASIAYAQIYVGVHYPMDVFFGGLLGTGIGLLTSRLNTYILCTRSGKAL
jgi:membrane-associated phospholipid phosphatase